ncbi:hypothetical protein HIM_05953 [Hirsutella minnesotensis 3608]|uniref:Peroxin 20 n=1 Tax=Hirsutella minnesotensis 3608 TaxID=1043627 RepID=A0A0F7ZUC1_9HYPO|nr:hypothetical protein HIM_05953 [Hirsutella minnesotensis 3608]
MAEASCSGGTPFKRLLDHQSRDTSQYQDRLVDRSGVGGPGQSFRSSSHHALPGQDNFGSFMNAPPSSAFHSLPVDPASRLTTHATALQPAHAHPAFAQPQTRPFNAPEASDWAADFSRFASQQQSQSTPAQAQRLPMSQYQPPAPTMHNFGMAFGQPQMGGFAPMLNSGAMASAQPVGADFDQEMARWMASHGGGNMSDVDAAMDQMARELEQNESLLPEASATLATKESTDARLSDPETPEISKLSLHEPAISRQQPPVTPAVESQDPSLSEEAATAKVKSDVAEVAEQLLEAVQHENGEKWQNSMFLSLMRDFRDGRKDIVENEIRQTGDDDVGDKPLT